VLICDEITSALDVSVQAVVLELLRELGDRLGLSLLFITHDLGVVATVAERTLVLESGSICEEGATAAVLASPVHPYTQRLLDAAPSLSAAIDAWDAAGAVPVASETGQPV
jgi:peptide/nickel transport system ATP-binding protein